MKILQRIKSLIMVIFVLSMTISVLQTSVHVSAQTAAYANPQLLVDAKWVSENKDAPGVVVVDVRSAADYAKGHIPGAINFQAAKLLRDVDSRILPVSTMTKKLGDAGISELNTVVYYGTKADWNPTVSFWILDYLGATHVSVFWGGIDDWIAAGYPTSTDPTTLAATTFNASVNADRYASTQWVLDHLGDSSVVILDTRTAAEYSGTDIRALRGGHIPGAINIDQANNLDDQKNMLPADQLAAVYAGVDNTKEIVPYCYTGGRGSMTYFALRLLGYPKVRLYDDSWIIWANNLTLPVENETWLDIHGIQKDVTSLKGTANGLQANVAQLNATADSLQATVAQLNATANSLQAKVDQLNATVNSIYGAYLVGILGVILAIWAGTRKRKT